MTMGPSWLYYLFGVLMLCLAAYCSVVLVLGVLSGRTAGWDVELHHVVMGVAMAGMFVVEWSFGPNAMWELFFASFLVWFILQAGRSLLAYGVHLPHSAVHALMNLAMLLMYWYPMSSSGGSMSGSMASSQSTGRVDPGFAFVIAFLLILSAVFTLASQHKGCSVYGTHVRLTTPTRCSGAVPTSAARAADGSPALATALQRRVSTPRLLDTSHVVMCVAMATMLVLML